MLREDRGRMIPLPDACHGPRFFFLPPSPPQSESSPGLNRSLLRHPMRTYQISLASWQPARWSGYLGFQFLKTAFQKALFFFLKDGNRVRIQCLMLASNLQSFSEEFYQVIIISYFLSGPMWNRSQCIITRVIQGMKFFHTKNPCQVSVSEWERKYTF